MKTEADCIFCKIIARDIPASIVFEDELFVAFLDRGPVNPGHTLLVPKNHDRNLLHMSEELLTQLGPRLKTISHAVQAATKADGINIIANNEAAAGQIIFHTHIHIIPRFAGDGFEHWHGADTPTEEMFADLHTKISHELN